MPPVPGGVVWWDLKGKRHHTEHPPPASTAVATQMLIIGLGLVLSAIGVFVISSFISGSSAMIILGIVLCVVGIFVLIIGCWLLEGPAFHILYGIVFCLGGSLNAYMVQGSAVSTDPYSVGVPRPATVMSPLIHECTRTFQELTTPPSEVGCRVSGGSVYYTLYGTHLRVYSDMTTLTICRPGSSSSLHTDVMVWIAAPLPSPILNLSRSQFGENEFFDVCYWRMLIMVGLDLRYSRLGTKKSK